MDGSSGVGNKDTNESKKTGNSEGVTPSTSSNPAKDQGVSNAGVMSPKSLGATLHASGVQDSPKKRKRAATQGDIKLIRQNVADGHCDLPADMLPEIPKPKAKGTPKKKALADPARRKSTDGNLPPAPKKRHERARTPSDSWHGDDTSQEPISTLSVRLTSPSASHRAHPLFKETRIPILYNGHLESNQMFNHWIETMYRLPCDYNIEIPEWIPMQIRDEVREIVRQMREKWRTYYTGKLKKGPDARINMLCELPYCTNL